ncbi:hypothetical protein [Pedobacter jeongneungensis]|uniref:hypothetical protein n=1 Tax=Pedobacter jeongneungensis TaxID=947309 RepID=UPI000468CC5C|nr:hypothetical protein [Pedobacter jeongneungensis]
MEKLNGRDPPPSQNAQSPQLVLKAETIEFALAIYNQFLKFLNSKNMKTTIIENGKSNGQLSNTPASVNPVNPNAPSVKEEKAAEAKTADKPAIEPSKKEIKAELATTAKPALNLEETIKVVEKLSRAKKQRDKLVETIDTLDKFEVAQQENAEETDGDIFQNCELILEDDVRNKFITRNPFIIKTVAEMVKTLCLQKREEIESQMVLPQ